MRHPDRRALRVLLGLTLLLTGLSARAADTDGVPVDLMLDVSPREAVALQRVPAVDLAATRAEDTLASPDGGAVRYARGWPVDLTPANSGVWETLATGERVWRLRVGCPDVLSLHLGFARYDLPFGARLQIYAADGSGPVLGFDYEDVRSHGQLWTPVLLTDEVVIELRTEPGAWTGDGLRLSVIGRGYRYFGEEAVDKAGDCNIDVVCPEGDDWREEIATVGVYSKTGPDIDSFYCTGVMMNNTDQDMRPLFLTAFHCGVDADTAPSVVVYWNFESPVCGEQSGGRTDQFTSGSTLLADRYQSDFALLELDSQPDPVFGVKYAGWDRSAGNPSSGTAIHHPSTDEKSISFEYDPLTTTSYGDDTGPGDGTHLRVADWDAGTTEGGSSGSPLFGPNKLVVGQLHGGWASCLNDRPDWYGRLSVSWGAGTTPAARLRDWLDPRGTGVTTLALFDPENPGGPVPGGETLTVLSVSPRPFRDQVTVDFRLSKSQGVHAMVLDIRGRLVADLGTTEYPEGDQQVSWNGRSGNGRTLPSGLYVMRLTSTDGEDSARLVHIH